MTTTAPRAMSAARQISSARAIVGALQILNAADLESARAELLDAMGSDDFAPIAAQWAADLDLRLLDLEVAAAGSPVDYGAARAIAAPAIRAARAYR